MDVAFTVDKYEILDLLGSGTFGSVYKGKNKTTGQVVALKQIKRLHSEDGFPLSTIREIKILRELNHKNIMKLIEIISDKASKTIYLTFEYCDFTIVDFLYGDMKKKLDISKHAQWIFKQVVDGLFELHKHKIMHRDIKPSNIMLTKEGIIKIGDFGISRFAFDNQRFSQNVAALPYRAPECYSSQYNIEMDIWALGCFLFELLTKSYLFKPQNTEIEMAKELALSCNVDVSNILTADGNKNAPKGSIQKLDCPECSECKDLLQQMLYVNKNERITIERIMEHPYYKEAKETPLFS